LPLFASRPFWARVGATVGAFALATLLGGCFDMDVDSPSAAWLGGGGAQSAKPRMMQVFVASMRRGESGSSALKLSPDGARFSLATLTFPPRHQAGALEAPMFGSPNPNEHIVIAGRRELDPDEFHAELASHVSGRVGVNRDVLVYVHGFNTSFDEARLRAAQIAYDSGFGGVTVLFTWPSQSQLLGYVSDKDSATASRDSLQDLLTTLSETPGVGKIHVLAHSMGGWLAMEALRQEAIAGKRTLDGHLGEVMLASPDIDMEVFAAQMSKLRPAAVTVFATNKDRALSLSSAIADSRVRIGAINPDDVADREKIEALGAKVYDLNSFSDGFIDHGAYAVTPQVLAAIGAGMRTPRPEDANKVSSIDATGDADKPAN